ncbi:low molecular weight protein-tyrosine-phosphatase [Helicobacter sp. 11S03491-1]|uniref:low molecular weight protein-tyrosine-phosphatase n=1 Tax=Helicobacter sp. 11S03491-1 TaxID=1476196 RepID=UPI0015DAB5C0|nr:low molecular weight protein-tyrosine-phosphatase [Helicobacter sp. 11S03491-1]
MRVLFVCLGNICRSPLAEGIAKHYAQKLFLDIKIDSAGTSGWHNGQKPCEGSVAIAKNHHIDISDFKSRKVSLYADSCFDLIVGMDKANVLDLLQMGFEKSKVCKIGKFGLENADIPDPYYYKDNKGFECIYQMIDTGVRNLLNYYFK